MLRNKKPKRHVSCQRRMERPVAAGVDESWSMNFMSDELFDGRRIRLLTIVDNLTRESLAIKVSASIRGQDVVEVLQRLMEQRRLPRTIRVDNGPEFTSKCLDQWAGLAGSQYHFRDVVGYMSLAQFEFLKQFVYLAGECRIHTDRSTIQQTLVGPCAPRSRAGRTT